jgi:hypothetical protein
MEESGTEAAMETRDTKTRRDELIGRLPTRGWDLKASKSVPVKNRTLEELVRIEHARRAAGEDAGSISHVETEFELDLIQLQELWMHLGLPT